MKKKTIFIIAGIVVAVAIAGALIANLAGSGNDTSKLLKDAISPELAALDDKVSETGIIATDVTYNVSTTVGGKVVKCNIEEGGLVNKGDVLYVLDSTELERQIRQASLGVEKADAAYRQSQKAKPDLNIITAAAGNLTKLYIHKGDIVSPGAKVADIIDNKNMLLKVPFNAAQIASITTGSGAAVQLLKSGSQIYGTVHKVYDYAEGQGDSRAAVYVEISVPNPGAIMAEDKATAIVNSIASMGEGTFYNFNEFSVFAKQSGTIETINFDEGEHIPSGVLLATIKNDTIDNAIENASLSLKDAKNALSELQSKLSDYTITAPISASVEKINVKQSEIAALQAPLAVLSDREAICAEALIDELYISKIHAGQRADVYVDALDKLKYTGTVSSIDEAGIAKNGVTYYKVKIWLDNTENLRIGMNLNIDIITGHKEKALTVPASYVKNGKVTVIKDDKAQEIDVTTGIKTEDKIEILSGLTLEDKILNPPQI